MTLFGLYVTCTERKCLFMQNNENVFIIVFCLNYAGAMQGHLHSKKSCVTLKFWKYIQNFLANSIWMGEYDLYANFHFLNVFFFFFNLNHLSFCHILRSVMDFGEQWNLFALFGRLFSVEECAVVVNFKHYSLLLLFESNGK